MLTLDDFLSHYDRQRRWTRLLVGAIPEELFDWTPGEATFSLGGLVRHLMQAEIFWRKLIVGAAAGEAYDPFRLEGAAGERFSRFGPLNVRASSDDRLGTTFAACLASWEKIERQTVEALKGLDPEAFAKPAVHPVTTLEAPVWEMCLMMVAHETHHRGQLTAHLKTLGVEWPPLFGP